MDSYLKEGDICGLGIYWLTTGGHAVTGWGFSYDASLSKSDRNYYKGIWISDSDDGAGLGRLAPDVIRYCPIKWSTKGYIVNFDASNIGILSQVVGLKRTFTINDYGQIYGETVQGGTQTVFIGGSAYNSIINSGGRQIVSGFGVTSGTVLNSGGSQIVSSAGTANSTTVNSGGYQTVSSGATAAGTTVNSGGVMYVTSGGIASGALNIAGGHVVLENAESAGSLTAVSYVLSAAKTNDVLITVNGGTFGSGSTTYSLSLDNTAVGSYILAAGADLSGMNGRSFTITYNYLNVNLNVGSSYVFSDGNKLSLSVTRNTSDQLTAVFSADTRPPAAPVGLSRAVSGKSVALDWADSTDADSNVKRYEIRVDNNANFRSPEYTAATIASGFTLNNMTDGTYYWDVRARDNAGNYSAWTPGTSFVVDAAAPSAPARLTRTVTGNSVALDWSNANDKTSGVKQYEVQVDNNADFSSPEYTATPVASTATFNGLTENDYFWRVRTQDNSGNYSAWSAGSGFVGDLVGNNINNASPLAAASVTGAVGFGDSADVYKLTMASAGTLTLGLTGLSGNANMFLLNSYGSILKYSMNTGSADEAINNAALQAGTYYIKITPGAGVNGTDYTLTDAISYFDGDTKDNAGNSFATAKIITPSVQTGWAGLGDNDDYYRFDLAAASQATLRLHDMTGGNVNLLLYNTQGRLLKASVKPGALEDVITANLAAGTYYARVNAFSGNIDYKLDFNKKDGFGMLAG